MFVQLINDLPKPLFSQLITMDGTDAFYYNPSDQSSEPANSAMPWPILFTISCFSNKHIFYRALPLV